MNPSGRRLDRLTVFSHLWAIAGLTESARWLWDGTAWSWLLLAAALALLARPRSLTCLVVWAVVQACFHGLAPHTPWNHGAFIALANVAILASVARVYVRSRRGGDQVSREAIVEHFAPALRVSLILLYAFAFLHKLNWDYLDPRFSCADQVLTWLNTKYRILPTGPTLTTFGIWSSLFVEGFVPLLLCSRYTARFGLIIGFTFHLALSQFGGLYGFAAAMYAVYYLFLPAGFTDDVGARLASLWQRLRLDPVRAWIGPVLATAILTSGLLLHVLRGSSALSAGLWWWNLWILGVVACFGPQLLGALRRTEAATLSPRWLPLAGVPLLVVYNGVCPYLGLKTESSWAMYSNLRTEIRPNHVFIPAWLQVAGYQQDLVEIVETSLPQLQRYQREGLLLPFVEFRRISSAATADFTVTYERQGSVRHLHAAGGASNDPSVTTSAGWLTDMLLIFRPIDSVGPMQCRH
jgi:hypothetical protein